MNELDEAKDVLERKKRENRKLLDVAELTVFDLAIPDKAKLLCLYLLKTCDWFCLTRDEGRSALSLIMGCSEDQVSRYTRPFDEQGIIRIVGRGSNVKGKVHTYQIELDHPFWTGDAATVAKIAEELSRRTSKRSIAASTSESQHGRTRPMPDAAIAERGHSHGRTRPSEQPHAATDAAARAALPLSFPSSPSPPLGEEGWEVKLQQIRQMELPTLSDPCPPQYGDITEREHNAIVQAHGLVKPHVLIEGFQSNSNWSESLRARVGLAIDSYYLHVLDQRNNGFAYQYCSPHKKWVVKALDKILGESDVGPLALEIKRHYPQIWPSASSSGDVEVDEEKAALTWLKDPERSGTQSSFLNEKRQQVIGGKPLSQKQREAVINNWRAAHG